MVFWMIWDISDVWKRKGGIIYSVFQRIWNKLGSNMKKGFSNFREAFIMRVCLAGIEPARPVPETSELCFYEHSNTKTQWDASPLAGKCRACEAIGASLRTQVRTFKFCNLCPDSSLFSVLFYNNIPDHFLRPLKNDRQVFNAVL